MASRERDRRRALASGSQKRKKKTNVEERTKNDTTSNKEITDTSSLRLLALRRLRTLRVSVIIIKQKLKNCKLITFFDIRILHDI